MEHLTCAIPIKPSKIARTMQDDRAGLNLINSILSVSDQIVATTAWKDCSCEIWAVHQRYDPVAFFLSKEINVEYVVNDKNFFLEMYRIHSLFYFILISITNLAWLVLTLNYIFKCSIPVEFLCMSFFAWLAPFFNATKVPNLRFVGTFISTEFRAHFLSSCW